MKFDTENQALCILRINELHLNLTFKRLFKDIYRKFLIETNEAIAA